MEKSGVSYDKRKGIITDDFLQTSNPDIYASGDVTSKYKFTHISKEQAIMAVKNALYGNKENVNALIIPWCTFSDPEVAQVGMTELGAKTEGIPIETSVVEMANVDRAILDGETTGFVKLIC